MRNTRSLLIAVASLLALAPGALAHARLVRSSPAKAAQLPKSPEQIELWFNELLDDHFNTLEIYSAAQLHTASHTNLAKEKPLVDPADRTHLTLKVEPLAAGEYVVEWRVLSRDGHSAPGRFTFRIGTP